MRCKGALLDVRALYTLFPSNVGRSWSSIGINFQARDRETSLCIGNSKSGPESRVHWQCGEVIVRANVMAQ